MIINKFTKMRSSRKLCDKSERKKESKALLDIIYEAKRILKKKKI